MTARVALVSGGARGIGRAVVARLAADGYDVAFCYRADADAAAALVAEAEKHGGRVLAQQVDVPDAGAVGGWVKGVAGELGPLDAVVTSAGVLADKPLAMMADDDWNKVVDTSLDGTFHVCRAAVFDMM